MTLDGMTEQDIAAHVRAALGTPSGCVLREVLRTHCFMAPTGAPTDWHSGEQVAFRYGRMTLFQLLEFLETAQDTAAKGADGP